LQDKFLKKILRGGMEEWRTRKKSERKCGGAEKQGGVV
jgi:hypothetical protein